MTIPGLKSRATVAGPEHPRSSHSLPTRSGEGGVRAGATEIREPGIIVERVRVRGLETSIHRSRPRPHPSPLPAGQGEGDWPLGAFGRSWTARDDRGAP